MNSIVKAECDACSDDGWVDCPTCKAVGWIERSEPEGDSTCPTCEGYRYVLCPFCPTTDWMISLTKINTLRERYTVKPVPPCCVCGDKLTLQGYAGGFMEWGCNPLEQDFSNASKWRLKPGRGSADEYQPNGHYSKSKWRQPITGDTDVLALIDAYIALRKQVQP